MIWLTEHILFWHPDLIEGNLTLLIFSDSLQLSITDTRAFTINKKYRKKNGATNVLSFPFEGPNASPQNILGDIVICAPVVAREAQVAGTSAQDHWAHLVVHGILHLCGFNHKTHKQAEIMESLEVEILQRLGVSNPY